MFRLFVMLVWSQGSCLKAKGSRSWLTERTALGKWEYLRPHSRDLTSMPALVSSMAAWLRTCPSPVTNAWLSTWKGLNAWIGSIDYGTGWNSRNPTDKLYEMRVTNTQVGRMVVVTKKGFPGRHWLLFFLYHQQNMHQKKGHGIIICMHVSVCSCVCGSQVSSLWCHTPLFGTSTLISPVLTS